MGEGRSNREIYPGDELGAVWDFFIVISAHLSYCNIASLRFPIFPDEENEKRISFFSIEEGCAKATSVVQTLCLTHHGPKLGWVGSGGRHYNGKRNFLSPPPFH